MSRVYLNNFIVASLSTALIACAQTQTRHTGREKAENIQFTTGPCTGSLEINNENSRGLFQLSVIDSQITGKRYKEGKGFLLPKPVSTKEIDPNLVAGIVNTPNPGLRRRAVKKVKPKALGNHIKIYLGEEPISSKEALTFQASDSAALRALVAKSVPDPKDTTKFSQEYASFTVPQAPGHSGYYTTAYDWKEGEDLDNSLSTFNYRSLAMDTNDNLGGAYPIPSPPVVFDEYKNAKALSPEKYGQPLIINVMEDANQGPYVNSAALVIQVVESAKPAHNVTCVVPDDGRANKLEIPTVEEDPTTKAKREMPAGSVYVGIWRIYFVTATVADDTKGELTLQTGRAVLAMGEIPEKPKEQ